MTTQREAAKKLGVSFQHLNAVIKKRVRGSVELAIGIEELLGIPADELRPELKPLRKQAHTLLNPQPQEEPRR